MGILYNTVITLYNIFSSLPRIFVIIIWHCCLWFMCCRIELIFFLHKIPCSTCVHWTSYQLVPSYHLQIHFTLSLWYVSPQNHNIFHSKSVGICYGHLFLALPLNITNAPPLQIYGDTFGQNTRMVQGYHM